MIVLSNVRKLYDGTSAEVASVHEAVDLLIDDGKIRALEPHRERATGEGDAVVDCSSYTVTPGLIDCHGHVTLLGLSGADIDRMISPSSLLYVEKILYTTLVDGGVTTLRDVGGATHMMKRLVDDGTLIGPRLLIAICMLSTTGGHGDYRGPDRCHAELSKLWPEGPGRPSSLVDGPWECRKRIREIAACGADWIKICTSPGVASPTDKLEHRDFTEEETLAIVDEAMARGLKVAAHAHSNRGIELAIECGVHDIQHISYMDERMVEKANDKGCSVTPTSWVMTELLLQETLSPFVMEKARKVAEVHSTAVDYAATGELPILMGTDAVLPAMHGRNYMEVAHLMRDGLPALRAWYGSTGLAAETIGQTDTGTLREGQRADLLVASDDIVEDPELMDRGALVEVLKDGVGHRRGLTEIPQRDFVSTVRATPGLTSRDRSG